MIGIIIFVMAIFLLAIFIFLSVIDDADDNSYPNGGRDTYDQFGDKRFVILSGDSLTLYDRKDSESTGEFRYKEDDHTVELNVYGYLEKEPFVYAIGMYGYTRLNYNTGECLQSEDITTFSNEDQKVFESIVLNTENTKNTGDGSMC